MSMDYESYGKMDEKSPEEDMTKQVEKLISEINKVHLEYSKDYFETGAVEKMNLSRTISRVSIDHILSYRLNLHESINDYLMKADLEEVRFFYRVKTSESILDKIERYGQRTDQYPVNGWLNDIFGCRMVLETEDLALIEDQLDEWQEKYGLKNWYKRDKEGYKGIHIYFKNKNNFYFPWELQLWDKKDLDKNVESHRKKKRNFV